MGAAQVATVPRSGAAISQTRQRVFSGMQPSGNSHLGNYLGAIRNWVTQQDQYDNIFCVVDLHALSLPIDPATLRAKTLSLASVLLAAGIDPQRSILFAQSDVHEHTELCWLLSSVTQFGELRRMTQFKDKTAGQDEAVSAALFVYPVLQAADILLYDADLVPVGEDQKQHIELTRDAASRFNARYGETFVVPEPDIKPEGARIMALDDPTKKMSKSTGTPNSTIALSDDPDTIRRKIKRAVTDSDSEVRAAPDKPALANLLTIYGLLSGEPVDLIEQRYAGRGYGDFKKDLAEVVAEAITPIQQRLTRYEEDPDAVREVLRHGAERARAYAAPKMELVRERMGIGTTPSRVP
ncbi:MAG TPA: tryptophan--tRNA ligase [Thermomicrobiales bacterium]|nr:tryptophan--tRNA ligase [Thermomicrobiales bacterium]